MHKIVAMTLHNCFASYLRKVPNSDKYGNQILMLIIYPFMHVHVGVIAPPYPDSADEATHRLHL
jgi:hypothetical protein